MKKTTFMIMLIAFFMIASVISFAQEPEEMKGSMMGQEMKGSPMGGKGMMMHPGKMMKRMMGKTIVATKDGGVVVLIGNKLMKFDKNLNLTKEVEIKIDVESKKMMKKWGHEQKGSQTE